MIKIYCIWETQVKFKRTCVKRKLCEIKVQDHLKVLMKNGENDNDDIVYPQCYRNLTSHDAVRTFKDSGRVKRKMGKMIMMI